MKLQVNSNYYFNKSYDTKTRFIGYWHQINEIIKLNPKKVLEIGVGNGFVSKYLKERKVNIFTLDIDERLNPDAVGNVLNIPFPDESFDTVACYELLEHTYPINIFTMPALKYSVFLDLIRSYHCQI